MTGREREKDRPTQCWHLPHHHRSVTICLETNNFAEDCARAHSLELSAAGHTLAAVVDAPAGLVVVVDGGGGVVVVIDGGGGGSGGAASNDALSLGGQTKHVVVESGLDVDVGLGGNLLVHVWHELGKGDGGGHNGGEDGLPEKEDVINFWYITRRI